MLILSLCPKCSCEHDLSDKLLGDTVLCQRCSEPFVVVETKTEEAQTLGVESLYGSEDHFADPTASSHPDRLQPKLRLKSGMLDLMVPPPPRELWSGKVDDEPTERFRPFRHDSRAMEKFLDRDNVSDYSWLLVIGMLLATAVVFSFLGLVIFLFVKWGMGR